MLADNDVANQFYQRQLATLYNANDEPTKAIRIYNRLVEQNKPEDWEGKSTEKQLTMMFRRSGALRGRGDARLSTGEHKEAVADYEEALKLGYETRKLQEEESMELIPIDDGVLNNLAWVLATSPKDDVRDGDRAIELATEAAEITEFKQAHILSTLASGYAESGDFEKAIEWIEKAIEVNRQVGEEAVNKSATDEQKASLQKEFESYKEGKPWRELQDVEKEKKEKKKAAAKEKAEKENDKKPEKPDSKESDEDEEDDKESDQEDEEEDKDDEDEKEKSDENEGGKQLSLTS